MVERIKVEEYEVFSQCQADQQSVQYSAVLFLDKLYSYVF